jgi:hypothetical protein
MISTFEFAMRLLMRHEGGFVDHPKLIRDAIEAALFSRGTVAQDSPPDTAVQQCSHQGCSREKLAKGLCNTHYIRFRRGADMDAAIRARNKNSICFRCDAPLNGKGGWNLCAKHYKRERLATIKATIVALFGGCCADCNGVFPQAAYDFHHLSDKEDSIALLMSKASAQDIAAEAAKCVLLCANCHRIRHFNIASVDP